MEQIDRARLAALSGPERAGLNAALLKAFPRRSSLARFLLFELDQSLEHHAADADDMRTTVFKVVEAAYTDDWLVDIVEAAVRTSRNKALHEWAQPYLLTSTPTAAPALPGASQSAGISPDRPSDAFLPGSGGTENAMQLVNPAILADPTARIPPSTLSAAAAAALTSRTSADAPLVFVSYGHAANDDDQFELFVDELRAAIVRTTGVSKAQSVYVDTLLPVGARWSPTLMDALAHCRVLMPFYSVGLFRSRGCGREWTYFQERQNDFERLVGRPANSIVPVLWDNPDNYAPYLGRETFSTVQFSPNGAEFRRYRESGMRRLFSRRETYHVDVRTVRDYLADRVAELVRQPPLPPGSPNIDFDAIVPAFGG